MFSLILVLSQSLVLGLAHRHMDSNLVRCGLWKMLGRIINQFAETVIANISMN